MNKSLKKILWCCNMVLGLGFLTLVYISLVISSLVLIILSPFIAIFGANAVKLRYSTPESWWELYKSDLITLCTDSLPIVVFLRG